MLSVLGEGKCKVPKKQAAVAVPSFQKKNSKRHPEKRRGQKQLPYKKKGTTQVFQV